MYQAHCCSSSVWNFLWYRCALRSLFSFTNDKTFVGVYNLGPPTVTCINPKCCQSLHSNSAMLLERHLSEPVTYPVTVFSKEFGAVPAYTTSLYCRGMFSTFITHCSFHLCSGCFTRYHPNYYVHSDAQICTYHSHTIVEFIQTEQHYYMASSLCELFATMLATSW